MELIAIYEVVLINGKKYWFCSKGCMHLKYSEKKCLYFNKELINDVEKCKSYNECLECFNKTKNI